MAQDDKKVLCVVLHISGTVHHMISFVEHKCKVIISPCIFFIFSKFLFFWVARRVIGKKMPKMTKKLCPLHLICQELYIISSLFMVCIRKRIISPGVFLHFFQILIFGINSGVKGQKMTQNDKKMSVALHISGRIHHMIVIFGTQV